MLRVHKYIRENKNLIQNIARPGNAVCQCQTREKPLVS